MDGFERITGREHDGLVEMCIRDRYTHPLGLFRLARAIFSASSASSAGASSKRNSPGGSSMRPKMQKRSNGQKGLPLPTGNP